jgi:hypothetical protein
VCVCVCVDVCVCVCDIVRVSVCAFGWADVGGWVAVAVAVCSNGFVCRWVGGA